MSSLRALAVLAFVLAAMLFISLNSGTWLITPDSTDYLEGARSLARLEGYLNANGTPETLVPPGTSAVYALAALVPSADFFYFNLVTKLLAFAFVALAFLVVRRAAGDGAALIVALFLTFNTRLLFESTRILSDIPFSAAFMATLWLFPQDRLEGLSVRETLTLGGLVTLCYVMRPAGLFVYLGYVVYVATSVRANRARTLALLSAVLAAAALALSLRARLEGATISYWQLVLVRRPWVMDSGFPGLTDWYERITVNGTAILRLVWAATSNERLAPAGPVVILLIVVGLAGELVNRRRPLHLCLLACYLPALLLPASNLEPRYLLPILPLLGLLAASGAAAVIDRLPSERGRWSARLALIAILAINPYWTEGRSFATDMRKELNRAGGRPITYRGHELFVQLVERQRATLRLTDSVATMHANILRYFLPPGTRVRNIPLTEDVETAHRILRGSGTTVIYGDKTVTSWRYLEPVIRTYPASFELEAENRDAAIYRLRP